MSLSFSVHMLFSCDQIRALKKRADETRRLMDDKRLGDAVELQRQIEQANVELKELRAKQEVSLRSSLV